MDRREFLKSSAVAVSGARWMRPLPAAAEEPKRGGTLLWGHSETTQNLDIHLTYTASTVRLLQNVHDSIVTVDRNFNVIPNLAERFERGD